MGPATSSSSRRDARCLVVARRRRRIVGVGSGICVRALGFVGNMIVAEGHRRRGVGSAILDAVVDFLEPSAAAAAWS